MGSQIAFHILGVTWQGFFKFGLKVSFFTLSECLERDVWSPQCLESSGMCFQYRIFKTVEMFCACLSPIGLVRTFSALSKHN